MHVSINQQVQLQIIAQMEATYPNEGGGFLLGQSDGDTVTIADIVGVENVFETEEQYHRYAMTPQNWAQVEDEADERGYTVVGYYHSHPNAPAIPSEFDRTHALPNFTYVITSVREGKAAEMRVWRLKDDRSAFDEGTLEIKG